MPKLQYPHVFDHGLIGTACKEDIKHREAFLYVPHKIMISVNKTKENPILKKIINENPHIFITQEGEEEKD